MSKPSKTAPRDWLIDMHYTVSCTVFASSKKEAIEKAMHLPATPGEWEFRQVVDAQDYELMEYGEYMDYEKYFIDDKEVSEDEFRKFLGDHYFLSDEIYKVKDTGNDKWIAYTSTEWVDDKAPYFDSIYGDTREWGGDDDKDD